MIFIKEYSDKNKKIYSHLQPIVDYLLEIGNENTHEFMWGINRTGYFFHFKKSIDFKKLQDDFIFPDSIELNKKNQTIICTKTLSVIKGNMK